MIQAFRDSRRQAQTSSFLTSVQEFVEQMQAQGYAAASVKASTRLVKDFLIWLDQRGIERQSLSAKHVTDYLNDRWLHRRRRRGDTFTLHTFVRLVVPDGCKARVSIWRNTTTMAALDTAKGNATNSPSALTRMRVTTSWSRLYRQTSKYRNWKTNQSDEWLVKVSSKQTTLWFAPLRRRK